MPSKGSEKGEDTLFPIEASELGDVSGKRLAHLQCHIGVDTLSLARRGALATGLDFSSVAVQSAQRLAAETKLPAHFVRADVYDAASAMQGPFDIVYVTWGSLNWLPGIWRWARVVAELLSPGGFLYLAEQHPAISIMKEAAGGPFRASRGARRPTGRSSAIFKRVTPARSFETAACTSGSIRCRTFSAPCSRRVSGSTFSMSTTCCPGRAFR